ncbi:hypothetical protein F2P56_007271 [Juglans regia]|uniref:Uncharacterized protein n=1 Tax=Juglans regia TaxID=51240 RepID=A0A833Y1L0_JUGRE|nr:hypothetical protein F2P56_007271 [Juglans regia]
MHFLFLFHITAAKASLYVLKFYCVFCSDSFNNILQMLPSKDANFVGYTYKNFEIVNEDHIPGIAELKKKNNKPKRPSIRSLFDLYAFPPSSQTHLILLIGLLWEISLTFCQHNQRSLKAPNPSHCASLLDLHNIKINGL